MVYTSRLHIRRLWQSRPVIISLVAGSALLIGTGVWAVAGPVAGILSNAGAPAAVLGNSGSGPATGSGSDSADSTLAIAGAASPSPLKTAASPAASAATGMDSGTEAAQKFGWQLATSDEFNGTGLGASWGAYNGAGHAGNGKRSPAQASVAGGLLTIAGTADGTTEGISWKGGQQYGRWEARMRAPAGCGCYHPVLLLWPDAEDWPVGGEVDYAEVSGADRSDVDFFLHYSASNQQLHDNRKLDVTQWHNYAVEWTPQGMTGYIDGVAWFHTTDTKVLPPRTMHATIQLDWFPGGGGTGSMQVDWMRIYKP